MANLFTKFLVLSDQVFGDLICLERFLVLSIDEEAVALCFEFFGLCKMVID